MRQNKIRDRRERQLWREIKEGESLYQKTYDFSERDRETEGQRDRGTEGQRGGKRKRKMDGNKK